MTSTYSFPTTCQYQDSPRYECIQGRQTRDADPGLCAIYAHHDSSLTASPQQPRLTTPAPRHPKQATHLCAPPLLSPNCSSAPLKLRTLCPSTCAPTFPAANQSHALTAHPSNCADRPWWSEYALGIFQDPRPVLRPSVAREKRPVCRQQLGGARGKRDFFSKQKTSAISFFRPLSQFCCPTVSANVVRVDADDRTKKA